jgi:hypothetical protein
MARRIAGTGGRARAEGKSVELGAESWRREARTPNLAAILKSDMAKRLSWDAAAACFAFQMRAG